LRIAVAGKVGSRDAGGAPGGGGVGDVVGELLKDAIWDLAGS
jgi:hypothetical protein